MLKFQEGDFLATYNKDPDFLGLNIQYFQRFGLGHKYPTWKYTHILVIDEITPSMVGLAEQTAPYAKRRYVPKDALDTWIWQKSFHLYRPNFTITPHGIAALQGYVDGRTHRKSPYDAQQLIMYWRNCFAYRFQGLPKEKYISKWWIFKERSLEDVCSSFGALALKAIMDAEKLDFSRAFGGIHLSYIAPSHIGNSAVLTHINSA